MVAQHLQKPARHGDKTIDVDHQLVDLLEWCWERDIDTVCSCQGGESSLPYIMFASADDAQNFLSAMSTLSREISEKATAVQPLSAHDDQAWQLQALQGGHSGQGEAIRISVIIPPRDLDLIRSIISA